MEPYFSIIVKHQGAPAEIRFQRRNGNFLYMNTNSQGIGKYTHIPNLPEDL